MLSFFPKNLKFYDGNALTGSDPHLLFAKASKIFMELRKTKEPPYISKNTSIHNEAMISNKATIGHYVTVSKDAKVGDKVRVGAGTFVGEK